MAPPTRRSASPSDIPDAPPSAADDLIDVEAPAAGGGAVDTAAYAAGGRATRGRKRGAPSVMEAQAPPPPPAAAPDAPAGEVDPPAGGAPPPPPAGPGLGGGGAMVAPTEAGDLLDRAGLAAVRLAAERPWPQVSLRDVAQAAEVAFAELYAAAPGKSALLLAFSTRLDRRALERIDGDRQPSARDRLFEAMMSRLEVMEPHRDALLAIARSERLSLAPALPRTVRALLEGSGVDTAGGRGALRLAAVAGVWARTLQVWRDDEGALNRTMAEIDKLLTRADKRLSRVGAGFQGAG